MGKGRVVAIHHISLSILIGIFVGSLLGKHPMAAFINVKLCWVLVCGFFFLNTQNYLSEIGI